MKKTLLFLALGAFMAASVSANACDDAKAIASKSGKKATSSCCTAKTAKTAKTPDCCAAHTATAATTGTAGATTATASVKPAPKACCAKKATKKS